MKTTFAILLLPTLAATLAAAPPASPLFDPRRDLISLHYDHAPDRDDGHSAAADLTLLESLHGKPWIANHAVAVSGAYGRNAKTFNPKSDAVMDACWNDCGGWLDAHRNRRNALDSLVHRWRAAIENGGTVWIKEGGQSDLTADAIRRLRADLPTVDTRSRVRIIQHSDWNENQTTPAALLYVRTHAAYLRIPDANRYLNRKGGDPAFQQAASSHPRFGRAWRAAFNYYPPRLRLDFSDTGELLHILRLGEIDIDTFRRRWLDQAAPPAGT